MWLIHGNTNEISQCPPTSKFYKEKHKGHHASIWLPSNLREKKNPEMCEFFSLNDRKAKLFPKVHLRIIPSWENGFLLTPKLFIKYNKIILPEILHANLGR